MRGISKGCNGIGMKRRFGYRLLTAEGWVTSCLNRTPGSLINDFERIDERESWIRHERQNELPLIIWFQVIEAQDNPAIHLPCSLDDVELPLECDPVEEDVELRATFIGVPSFGEI